MGGCKALVAHFYTCIIWLLVYQVYLCISSIYVLNNIYIKSANTYVPVQVKLLSNSHIKACFGIYIGITWEVFWALIYAASG